MVIARIWALGASDLDLYLYNPTSSLLAQVPHHPQLPAQMFSNAITSNNIADLWHSFHWESPCRGCPKIRKIYVHPDWRNFSLDEFFTARFANNNKNIILKCPRHPRSLYHAGQFQIKLCKEENFLSIFFTSNNRNHNALQPKSLLLLAMWKIWHSDCDSKITQGS